MDADTALKKALEEQKRRRDLILKAKEAKRLLLASKRRQNLVVKLAQEGIKHSLFQHHKKVHKEYENLQY
jgi:hypothetical protein